MELHQLRYFLKAAELGNFTQAAGECHVSQPSLSQQIIKLEQELGQPLFERSGRGVELTEAGRLLQPRADQILGLIDQARREITDDGETGLLTIGAIPTIAPYYLPQLVHYLRTELPRANFLVHEDTTESGLRRVLSGEWDLAIIALPMKVEHLEVQKLFTEELWLALPNHHPLAKLDKVPLHDIDHEPVLMLGEGHCLSEQVLDYCRRKNSSIVETGKLAQLTTLLELVALGQGVSFIPDMARRRERCVECQYRQIAGDPPTRDIAMVWNDYRYQTRLLKRCRELIIAAGHSGRP